MTTFATIPSNIRPPLFYSEVDASQAAAPSQQKRGLVIAQRLSTGAVAEGVPTLLPSTQAAIDAFGRGSFMHLLVAAYRQNDPFGELWGIALDDDGGGTEATGTITASGTATAAGTISLYIAGVLVEVAVSSGDTANDVASAIRTAVNANTDLPVTAGVGAAVVTLTCRHKGTLGNDIDVRHSYLGSAGGQALPAGIGLAIVAMASGATDPALTNAISAMADTEYDWIAQPWPDTSHMDALQTEMNDATGRWSPTRQVYGHAFTCDRDTVSNLQTLGDGRNDQHNSIIGASTDTPNMALEILGAVMAHVAQVLGSDPSLPVQFRKLVGILPPQTPSNAFTITERNTLLHDGIATIVSDRTAVYVERLVTTHQTLSGSPSTAYLDVQTMYQLAEIQRRIRSVFKTKYPSHKLVSDITKLKAGQKAISPAIAKAECLAELRAMEEEGIVENVDTSKKYLTVTRPGGDPNRLDIVLPPDLVNQLRIAAFKVQFRLQFAA